jgi:lipopolysaccharide export system protein LptA
MRYFILAIAAALAATPAALAAQANSCLLEYQNGPWTAVGDPANRVISADGPLLVKCAGGEELRADSAVIYQAMNEVHLFGKVDFQDPTRTLTADRAIYNSGTGRLFAQGNVIFTDKQRGSTLRGPELEYYKAMPGRPDAQAIATQRPHLTLVPRGGGGQRRDPMEIDGDRITSTGDKFMTAEGNVVIVSKDVNSTAATAFYDATAERMELRTAARVRNPRYELQGEYIESNLRDGKLTRVLARTNARLDSERLDVTGPQLLMFFENDKLQRVVSGQEPQTAAPRDSTKALPRSVALASGFRLEADSLEAIMPGQELREMHAVGSAHGLAWDTLAAGAPGDTAARRQRVTAPPEALEDRDLILADTIIGYFARDTAARRAARGDSAEAKTKIERMVAIGNARSVYRLRDDKAPAGQKPAINYLNADHVDLAFRDGEVDDARARGVHRGVYLDPGQQRRQPADSAAAAAAPAGRTAAGTTAARTPTPGRAPAPGTPSAAGTAAQAPRPAPAGAPGRGTRIPTARPTTPAAPATPPQETRP